MPRRRRVWRQRGKWEVSVKEAVIKPDLRMWSGQCWLSISMELRIP